MEFNAETSPPAGPSTREQPSEPLLSESSRSPEGGRSDSPPPRTPTRKDSPGRGSPRMSPLISALESIPKALYKTLTAQSLDSRERERKEVFAWGWGLNGQLGLNLDVVAGFAAQGGNISFPTKIDKLSAFKVVQVVCGSRCTLALTDTGTVYSFGRGDDGQLGHDAMSGNMSTPRLVESLLRTPIKHISCRSSHVAAVSDKHQLWMWGRGDEGQLGVGDTKSIFLPTRVPALSAVRIIKAETGRQHTIALSAEGFVYVMGSSSDGQLGLGSTEAFDEPQLLASLENVIDISCGSRHSLALTASGEVYAWGWNVYGQLGLGHTNTVYIPTLVRFARPVISITCGFRHSFAQTQDGRWWAWGWNQFNQLGHSVSHGVGHACSSPTESTEVMAVANGQSVVVKAGGRHSAVLDNNGVVYTFGRGSDGQLGHADLQDSMRPTLVKTLRDHKATEIALGWAHTVAVTRPPVGGTEVTASEVSLKLRRGDWDAFFGVFFNVLINLILITNLCQGVVGLSDEFVSERILPGSGYALFLGSTFFGLQSRALTQSRGYSSTAQPFGLDTPILLSTIFLLMVPEYNATKDPEAAWRLGLFSAFVIGVLQILGGFVGDSLRRTIPRPALLSALAGIGLGFIAEGFMFQVFNDPVIAIAPVIIIWACYAAGVSLPLGMPGSMAAVLFGVITAFICWGAGYDFWEPFQEHVGTTPHPGRTSFHALFTAFGDAHSWTQLALIVPLCVINIVGSLVNLEGAASVGDRYSTRWSMVATGSATIVGACLGNPFPCCIFMGHSAWKAVGARTSYVFLCGAAALAFCLFNGVKALVQILPLESTVGILLWVGLAITAQAFEASPHEKTQLLAVTVGLLPSLASWLQGTVNNFLLKADSSLCQVLDASKEDLYSTGIISFSQGFLLLAVLHATLMVFITDRRFHHATFIALLLSVFSFFGFVHAFRCSATNSIEPFLAVAAAPEEAVGYLLGASVLLLLHLTGYSADEADSISDTGRSLLARITAFPRSVASRFRKRTTVDVYMRAEDTI